MNNFNEGCIETKYHKDDIPICDPNFEFKLFRPLMVEPCKKTQKENTMAYQDCCKSSANTAGSSASIVVEAQRDESKIYLLDRLRVIRQGFRGKIAELFAPLHPKNRTEAMKWMKEGNYHFSKSFLKKASLDTADEEDDENYFDNYLLFEGMLWGKKEYDDKACLAAYDTLETAYRKAVDIVTVLTDEAKRLAALHEFEAYQVA